MLLKIYLSGPIAHCNDDECMGWRDYMKKTHSGYKGLNASRTNPDVHFIDPMRRDYRHLDRDEKIMSSFEDQKKIVSLDKADIVQSDAMIVWTGLPFPSAGTSMEIMYAFEHGKYTVTVNPRGVILSPWVYYHSHKVVTDLDDAMEAIMRYFTS